MRDQSSVPLGDGNPGEGPDGQRRFTRADYDRLDFFQQGLVSYMQAAWNDQVPDRCLYPRGGIAWRQWHEGQARGVQIAQDGDDE